MADSKVGRDCVNFEDEVTDLIDTINSTGEFSAAEITKCEKCGEWKIPRYDQTTRRMTRKHICSAQKERRDG